MSDSLVDAVRRAALPVRTDHLYVLEEVGEARFVLIGEASHGTDEFYRERAEITKQLIVEHGFTAVAVEGDWPDAYRVNRYVRGQSNDANATEALAGFRRFPAWMWRNTVVRDFTEWLRQHNRTAASKTGFYGLDLYSLYASLEAVIRYLDETDPEAARRARARYSCFDHATGDVESYGFHTSLGLHPSCEAEVIAQLEELRRTAATPPLADDERFYAEQNARVAVNAEAYYRSLFGRRISSWNLRDRHMVETLEALVDHLERREGVTAKVVVWAHNSHLGDARATDMGDAGELTVGQLVRQRYREEVTLIGLTTHAGTVTAASAWGATLERKVVRPSLPNSYERVFHDTKLPRFLLPLGPNAPDLLRERLLERAIGVIYLPDTERQSHYFHATLPDQFDLLLHFDQTHALEPLDPTAGWLGAEVPETFPTAV
jgi:erythromycin esterase-like protein